MATIFFSPSKYVQGPGELGKLGDYAKAYGKKALILISENGRKRFGKTLSDSFAGTGCDCQFEYFGGECSKTEIGRLQAIVRQQGCDLVVGVGGGKIFDTAKAVAYYEQTAVFICPTIASTDAPCSALSVIYSDEGVFEEYLFLKHNPELVLMDSAVISASPLRLTVAGMGDALATYFEARACAASGAVTCAGGQVGHAALSLAKLCFDTLMADGPAAKADLENKQCTEAVERIIEANTLLSGIGFESGGLAGAHAIHNGLTVLEECHHMYHGEKVAFGTLTQLVLEKTDKNTMEQIISWCITLGLPVTLGELGVSEVTEDKAMRVAEAACAANDTIHNLPFEVTPQSVCAAIIEADALGRAARSK